MTQFIEIKRAEVHNLKGVSVDIPRNQLVVITGVSGSENLRSLSILYSLKDSAVTLRALVLMRDNS